jgi:isocitrate dehydrogenase kinase/phosphatase
MESYKLAAEHILLSFDSFHRLFFFETGLAGDRFTFRRWQEIKGANNRRLDLYKEHVSRCVETINDRFPDYIASKEFWVEAKREFSLMISERHDGPIVESFFNSVLRKIYITEGINEEIEFIPFVSESLTKDPFNPIFRIYYPKGKNKTEMLGEIVADFGFRFRFADLESDICYLAEKLEMDLMATYSTSEITRIDIVKPHFYRGKGLYVMGRLFLGTTIVPLCLPIVNPSDGAILDTVITNVDEVSMIFSFTRSYFFVRAENPLECVHFLHSIMPKKPVSELFSSIGYNRHAKTVQVKEFHYYLDHSADKFMFAPGIKGMVMSVFTLPGYNYVFKLIKDRFAPPKNISREHVIKQYRLVFMHDRVGRMADPQEFEYMHFDLNRFEPNLLEELLTLCSETCYIEGSQLIIKQLFTERKIRPLNMFVEENDFETSAKAILDYGNAVKELAAANVFPGDLLMKNFGVTRHGRVVFYDYDELCLLEECNFRPKPVSRDDYDEMSSDVWYTVNENDIFPEELRAFMVPQGKLKDVFLSKHEDLFFVKFWKEMQRKNQLGEVVDFYPYKRERA